MFGTRHGLSIDTPRASCLVDRAAPIEPTSITCAQVRIAAQNRVTAPIQPVDWSRQDIGPDRTWCGIARRCSPRCKRAGSSPAGGCTSSSNRRKPPNASPATGSVISSARARRHSMLYDRAYACQHIWQLWLRRASDRDYSDRPGRQPPPPRSPALRHSGPRRCDR